MHHITSDRISPGQLRHQVRGGSDACFCRQIILSGSSWRCLPQPLQDYHKTRIWLELYSLAVCFVHPPLLVSLEGFQDLFEYTVLPTTIFKAVIYDILVTIDFLHTEAHMVHTGIWHRRQLIQLR